MVDARRMEVYALLMDGDFNLLKPTAPVILEEYAYEDVLAAVPSALLRRRRSQSPVHHSTPECLLYRPCVSFGARCRTAGSPEI